MASRPSSSLPHARGGVSVSKSLKGGALLSSPRTWGCFCLRSSSRCPMKVFPTHVGVFLPTGADSQPGTRLPHARGGVSCQEKFFARFTLSSPRTWGCFHSHRIPLLFHTVFPTHVGVFLPGRRSKRHTRSLPHARGGVSMLKADILELEKSSPRTWGGFRHLRRTDKAEKRLPHARGGVSGGEEESVELGGSSPRTWGCFSSKSPVKLNARVFPTHVGGRQAGVAPESPFPTVGAFHVCP